VNRNIFSRGTAVPQVKKIFEIILKYLTCSDENDSFNTEHQKATSGSLG